tara:strand:+ start:1189 stop:1557 length:369 start_codon:yes stop_codon:yes gene_type:complete
MGFNPVILTNGATMQHLKKYDHLITGGLYTEFGEYRGKPICLDGDLNPAFRAYLISIGVSDTRIKDLSKAFDQLWSALCPLGYENLQIISNEFEGLISACRKFAEIEDMRTNFNNSKGEELK